jgi:aryl-alcohol dehydrogenase-like predicted oxidoreductase
MGMSAMYGKSDDAESIATIHEAIERGVNLIDTGDFYGIGRNEMLIGRALQGERRDKVLLSVKFGALRAPDHSWIGFDSRPSIVKNALAHTLARLGVDYIDIYRPSRLDPNVPIEDTVGAIAEMVKAGYVRAIGLSEVGADTIRRANAVHPISDLQIEYSLISRSPEQSIFPALDELGIGVTAYGVLSRGLLSGSVPTGAGDFRARMPRFSGDNFEQNRLVVDKLQAIARAKGITGTQLAIAWVLAKNTGVVPLIGARTRVQLKESLAAVDVQLSPADLAEVEAAVSPAAIAGTRYDAHGMRTLDSEK